MHDSEPNAILRGGPSSLPPSERVRHVEDTGDKIKLPRGNRYEHFEPTAEIETSLGRPLRVYVWTGCTHVAE